MTLLRVWHALIYLGDGAVLLPCAALVFVWLIAAPASRRTGWWWLVAVLLVGGGAALSKLLYMVSGWHPAGWNFIGVSGHAAFSFLFFPSAGALVTSRQRTWLRVVAIALGACLAYAISIASWVLRDHSLAEVVLGGLWGALVAAVFVTVSWRHETQVPLLRSKWMVAGLLLLAMVAYRHEFPSTSV
ncbi:MAG: phosphatase PAP2 family protein, partial [Rhodanobacter sp.]